MMIAGMFSLRGQKNGRGLTGLFFAMEAIFVALLAVTGISSCPRKCQCIWRDSKITVDCSDQELAAIPTTVEANTQVRSHRGRVIEVVGDGIIPQGSPRIQGSF